MGFFARAIEKTVTTVRNIIGFNSTDSNNTQRRKSVITCSIGDVLNNLISYGDVGDKVEASKDKKAENNISSESEPKVDAQNAKQAEIKHKTQQSEAKPQIESEQDVKTTAKITKQKDNNTSKSSAEANSAQEELSKQKQILLDKCIKSNINFAKLRINMAALTGKTLVEFNNLDVKLQLALMSYVIESIDRVNEKQKEFNITDSQKFEAVVTDAALMYHFVTHDNEGNSIDIENLTPAELKKRRESFDIKLSKKREERLAEIESLPENQRAAAKEALKEELAGYRKHIFDELSKGDDDKKKAETALESLHNKLSFKQGFVTVPVGSGIAIV